MHYSPIPSNEADRLRSLYNLRVLDTPPEERFDRLTRLAKRLFEVPIALVSFVDENRQWFKSRQGLDMSETPREISFCAHAILGEGTLVVPNAHEDERFSESPLVTAHPNIRFYAGRPVKAPDGARVGTLCLMDHRPRELDAEDLHLLNDLGALVEEEFRNVELITTDELTGITNRRGFLSIAGHTLALCRRVGRPATLVMLDLDRFKEINDTLGHAAGDKLLKDFSRHLLEAFRDSDVVARLGGDEFCVLLSGTDEEDAARPLDHLRERLEAAAEAAPAGEPPIRFSAGAARYDPARHDTVDKLLADADRAMYEMKRSRSAARL
ncbi:MAG TPA: sensor domain-containing diguanylate cyclase [Longimicrobiales bacterium]|nr:sensor domain-containing diguanylate cyclase [Longimicrobiales bacterium]